jgi:hypothetical protein
MLDCKGILNIDTPVTMLVRFHSTSRVHEFVHLANVGIARSKSFVRFCWPVLIVHQNLVNLVKTRSYSDARPQISTTSAALASLVLWVNKRLVSVCQREFKFFVHGDDSVYFAIYFLVLYNSGIPVANIFVCYSV